MRTLVAVIVTLALLTFGFWIAVEQNSDTGKKPEDEVTTHQQERDNVSGELFNVEIVKCGLCGDVIFYQQRNLKGKVVYTYSYSHRCRTSLVHYRGMNMESSEAYVPEWLNKWQRKLKLRR